MARSETSAIEGRRLSFAYLHRSNAIQNSHVVSIFSYCKSRLMPLRHTCGSLLQAEVLTAHKGSFSSSYLQLYGNRERNRRVTRQRSNLPLCIVSETGNVLFSVVSSSDVLVGCPFRADKHTHEVWIDLSKSTYSDASSALQPNYDYRTGLFSRNRNFYVK